MLFAQRDGISMALAANPGFAETSCGYVGVSDGWQQLKKHFELRDHYERAEDGNIALTGKLDLLVGKGRAQVVLAFGRDPEEAGLIARESLLQSSDETLKSYVNGWLNWHQTLASPDPQDGLYSASAAVLRIHQDKGIPGAWIASLSIPWGFSKGDNDLGGYHLVWVRDLVESAAGLVAAGNSRSARDALVYLAATQEPEGMWPQNMWLNGSPYWGGVQLDEIAFPILLADLLRRNNQLGGIRPWPMILRAAGFLVRNGPITQQDRWEEDGGYSPFTLAVTIAGLLAAADFAETEQDPALAEYLRDTADAWNSLIESRTYVEGTDLASTCGVSGYYIRIAPPEDGQDDGASGRLPRGDIRVRNILGSGFFAGDHIVSPDCLALVRFGLRSASDPRITNTVRVIDHLLKSGTSSGPAWHRYNHDGYGEHEDGSPFDGVGIGRPWPLLTGERAHYELAAGNFGEARMLLEVMARQAGPGGLLPEQIWDSSDIPEKELFNGCSSGSAMPLVWAHAEYIKLVRSLADGKVFDMPPQPAARYTRASTSPLRLIWRFENPIARASSDSILRIECFAGAMIRWTMDNWRTFVDTPTNETPLGIHYVDFPPRTPSCPLEFTFFWTRVGRWEGRNFVIGSEPPASSADAPR
jgi:glucoamylase